MADNKYIIKFLLDYYITKIEKITYAKDSINTKCKNLQLLENEFEKDILCNIRLSDELKDNVRYLIQWSIASYNKMLNDMLNNEEKKKGLFSLKKTR
ncbi:MAG: hypothetical protein ACI4N3_03655 [Alphaproteobacteria bacterium]